MAQNLVLGVPKEIKTDEHRVSLTPLGAKVLVQLGFKVVVGKGAGVNSGFPDSAYLNSGATIVDEHEEVFKAADIIIKVKEPLASEYSLIKPHHVVFTFFHFAGSKELTDAMVASGATCIAYETIEKPDGSLPILAPMSEIAGRLSIQQGMRFLEKTQGGSGVLLAGVPGVIPGTVVVIGGGVAGTNAAMVAAGVGARVVILDNNIARLRTLSTLMPANVQTAFSTSSTIEQHLMEADVAVGAALVPGGKTPILVTRDMLLKMKPGSVFIDISIDQGGMTEVSRPTTHREPTFKVGETTVYCVANMPGCVPRTSTEAITNATLPYIIELAQRGWREAAARDPGLLKGLNIVQGKVTFERVASLFDLPYHEAQQFLKPTTAIHNSNAASGNANGMNGHASVKVHAV